MEFMITGDTSQGNTNDPLPARPDGTAILDQTQVVEWFNSWTKWNPIAAGGQAGAFNTFTGGIQQTFGKGGNATYVDIQRILATNTGANPTGIVGGGTYVTTLAISSNGDITLTEAATSSPVISFAGAPSALSTSVGSASTTSSFSVSGADMTAGITVTAPTGFEVSTSSNASFSSNITVGTSGTINSTPVYVRIPASASSGNYTGNITLSSTGAESKNISVTGTVTAPTPVISVSGTLSALSTTYGTASSTSNFTISGTNMTAPIIVTPPNGFQVSTSPTDNFSGNLTIQPTTGTINNTTIHVRLSAAANAGPYSGNISLTSTGATEKTIATVGSNVYQANPTIDSLPTAAELTFGSPLSAATLNATNAVVNAVVNGVSGQLTGGNWTYADGSVVPPAGNYTASVTYNPSLENKTNYTSTSGNITVTVNKARPTITRPPTAAELTYGSPLSAATLNANNAEVNGVSGPLSGGNWNYTNEAVTPPAGNYTANVTYTPSQANTANYTSTSGDITVTVNKATPNITTAPSASPILKGQTLAKSTISGAASVDGRFEFANTSTQPNATANHSVTFTPASNNYKIIEGLTVSVTVNESDKPVITSPITASGTFNELFQYQITATNSPTSFEANNLPPGLSINAGTGLISGASTQAGTYDVTLTLSNSAGDSEPTALTITINKASSTVTLGNLSHTYDGTLKSANSTTSPIIAGNVNYIYTGSNGTVYTQTSTPPAQAGSYTVVGTINDANYSGNATGTLTIDKAKPAIINLPTAAEITFGSPLSAATLNATNSLVNGVSGPLSIVQNWTYTDGTFVPPAGNYTASVTYNPSSANTANYTIASGNITVTVNKATPTIDKLPTAAEITYGSPLSAATLNATNSVVNGVSGPLSDGNWTYTDETFVPPAGNYTANVTYTPSQANTANYTIASGSTTVTVKKATPIINTIPTALPITLGQKLSESGLRDGIASVNGTFAFTDQNTQPAVGTSSQNVTFTPDDTDNYFTTRTTVNVLTQIAIQPINPTINENTSTVLSVSVTGTGLKYQWYKDSMLLHRETDSILKLKDITVDQTGSYSVEVTDANGNKFTSQSSDVTVNAVTPEITTQPSNVSVYPGGNATMRVIVKGAGHTYQWKKDGEPIPGETSNTLSLSDIILADAGEYTVSVKNSVTTVTSRSARLRVLTSDSNNQGSATARPSITSHPISQTIADGGTAILTASATGGSLSYQWLKNGSNITGANQASFTINSASIDNAGDYSVVVHNAMGFVTSNVAKITVNAPEIDVQQPVGSALTSGTSKISFGTARIGKAGISRTFTIKNIGNLNLNGLAITKAGAHSKEYTITRLKRRMLAPEAAITFRVTFKAKAVGQRTASIRIANNDRDENPFIINLAGEGAR
jgi:hypothetical protein